MYKLCLNRVTVFLSGRPNMTFFWAYWWYFLASSWKTKIHYDSTPNERANEWYNDSTNKQTKNEWINERTNERMNEWMSEWVNKWMNYRTYGLSPCCSRFSKKFPVISQTVAQMLLKKQSEVAFCNESCSKVSRKNKNFVWSDAKICKLYNKSKISKHFCAILQRNQRC